MTTSVAFRESPVMFPADGETLFGILTRPIATEPDLTVVLAPGGAGTMDSINRNRLWVTFARTLATRGVNVFRFDSHGAGESTGAQGRLRLDRPFAADLHGAIAWLASQGLTAYVLVGACFGARTALAAAPRMDGVRGMILATPFVRDVEQGHRVATLRAIDWTPRDYLHRVLSVRTFRALRHGKNWRVLAAVARGKVRSRRTGLEGSSAEGASGLVSPHFLDPFVVMAGRGVPSLMLFGADDDAFQEFSQERSRTLGRVLDAAGPSITIVAVPGRIHGLRSLASQAEFVDASTSWLLSTGFIHTTEG